MKLRVLVDAKGRVLGTQQITAMPAEGDAAGLLAGPGQTLHEVEIPDDIARLADLKELHRRVKMRLRQY